jgi:hypothetical protein
VNPFELPWKPSRKPGENSVNSLEAENGPAASTPDTVIWRFQKGAAAAEACRRVRYIAGHFA